MMKLINNSISILIGIAACINIVGCSNGEIRLSSNSDCRSINYPDLDTLPIFDPRIESELIQKNEELFKKSKKATLVNTNKSKIFTFTVKTVKTEKTDKSSSHETSETELITLNPGEELVLGCTQEAIFIFDESKRILRLDTFKLISLKYSITGEQEKSP